MGGTLNPNYDRNEMNSLLEPGQFVRHPDCPDWGLGQIQSVVGSRVTVTFEHQGKVLINAEVVGLETVELQEKKGLLF
jgi:hypothetical protein